MFPNQKHLRNQSVLNTQPRLQVLCCVYCMWVFPHQQEEIFAWSWFKASYTVPLNILVSKLERHRLHRLAPWQIGNWLDGHTTRVGVNGSVSKWRPVMGGIPQGLLLGLVIFKSQQQGNEFISVNVLERRDGIQRDMENLERWGYVNLTVFNNFRGMLLHKSIPSTNTGWSENVEIMLQIMFCWKNYF